MRTNRVSVAGLSPSTVTPSPVAAGSQDEGAPLMLCAAVLVVFAAGLVVAAVLAPEPIHRLDSDPDTSVRVLMVLNAASAAALATLFVHAAVVRRQRQQPQQPLQQQHQQLQLQHCEALVQLERLELSRVSLGVTDRNGCSSGSPSEPSRSAAFQIFSAPTDELTIEATDQTVPTDPQTSVQEAPLQSYGVLPLGTILKTESIPDDASLPLSPQSSNVVPSCPSLQTMTTAEADRRTSFKQRRPKVQMQLPTESPVLKDLIPRSDTERSGSFSRMQLAAAPFTQNSFTSESTEGGADRPRRSSLPTTRPITPSGERTTLSPRTRKTLPAVKPISSVGARARHDRRASSPAAFSPGALPLASTEDLLVRRANSGPRRHRTNTSGRTSPTPSFDGNEEADSPSRNVTGTSQSTMSPGSQGGTPARRSISVPDAPRSALAKEAVASAARARRFHSIAGLLSQAAEENMKGNLVSAPTEGSPGMASPREESERAVRRRSLDPGSPESETSDVGAAFARRMTPPVMQGSQGDTMSGSRSSIASGSSPPVQLQRSRRVTERDTPNSSLGGSSDAVTPCVQNLSERTLPRAMLIDIPDDDPGGALIGGLVPGGEEHQEEPILDELLLHFKDPVHEANFRDQYMLQGRVALASAFIGSVIVIGAGVLVACNCGHSIGMFSLLSAPPFLELYLLIRMVHVSSFLVQLCHFLCIAWLLICHLVYLLSIPSAHLQIPELRGTAGPALLLAAIIQVTVLAVRPLFWWVCAIALMIVSYAATIAAVVAVNRADSWQVSDGAALVLEVVGTAFMGVVITERYEARRRRSFAACVVLKGTVARCRHEQRRAFNLVKNFVPRRVFDTMVSSGGAWTGVCAQVHHGVVIATDLASFTKLCSGMSAAAVIRLLNKLFTNCDHYARLYGVEKVKTLGDAWIAAVHPADTAADYGAAADVALAIIGCVLQLADEEPDLKIRIGVGHGSLLSGMAGVRRAQYEVLGQALDEATLMESTGAPQSVQVSAGVAARIHHLFVVDGREPARKGGSGKFLVKRAGSCALSPQARRERPGSQSPVLTTPRFQQLSHPSKVECCQAVERFLLGERLTAAATEHAVLTSGSTGVLGRSFGGAATGIVRQTFLHHPSELRVRLFRGLDGTGLMRVVTLFFVSPIEEERFREHLRCTAGSTGIWFYLGFACCMAVLIETVVLCRVGWHLDNGELRTSTLFAFSVPLFSVLAALTVLLGKKQLPRTSVTSDAFDTPPLSLLLPRTLSAGLDQSRCRNPLTTPVMREDQMMPKWEQALIQLDGRAHPRTLEVSSLLAVVPLLAVPTTSMVEDDIPTSSVLVLLLVALLLVGLHPSLIFAVKAPLSVVTVVSAVCAHVPEHDATSGGVAAVCFLILGCAVGAAYLGELQRRHTWRDQQRLAEQQAAIDRNVGLSEQMLFNAVPEDVVAAFASGSAELVHDVDEATVGFLIFEDLVKVDVGACPAIVLPTLNTFLGAMDGVLESHDVEKVKNLPYIVVSGCPLPKANHARSVVCFAVAAAECVAQYNARYGTSVKVKIGVHSGKLSAGILGTTNFIYDVFGDSVNTASRLASNGVDGLVQVSQETAALTPEFLTEPRGKVFLKGKGNVACFLIVPPRLPGLSSSSSWGDRAATTVSRDSGRASSPFVKTQRTGEFAETDVIANVSSSPPGSEGAASPRQHGPAAD